MVRSTIVVRASDALPLAASVDDEQVAFRAANKFVCISNDLPNRQNTHYRSTSNKQNLYLGDLLRIPSHVFPLKADHIHTSMSHTRLGLLRESMFFAATL